MIDVLPYRMGGHERGEGQGKGSRCKWVYEKFANAQCAHESTRAAGAGCVLATWPSAGNSATQLPLPSTAQKGTQQSVDLSLHRGRGFWSAVLSRIEPSPGRPLWFTLRAAFVFPRGVTLDLVFSLSKVHVRAPSWFLARI